MAGINKQEDFQKTALRLPRDLHTKIIECAKNNNRTMNAEIVERLEASFRIIEGQVIRQTLPGPIEDRDEVYRRVMVQLNSLSELVEQIKDQKE